MTRTMYDAVTVASVPAGATLVAGYGDGYYQNTAAFRARFPHATVVEIAVFARDDLGTVLDVENGDATPAQAPGWVQARRAAGVDPTVYCNSSTWPAVRAAFQSAGVGEPHYWVARYDGDPTIPVGAIAKQYQDPGPYDLSSVADYWPGVDPAPSPTPVQEDDMPFTEDQIRQFVREEASGQVVRDANAFAVFWWLQAAISGTVPTGADGGWASLLQSAHAALAPETTAAAVWNHALPDWGLDATGKPVALGTSKSAYWHQVWGDVYAGQEKVLFAQVLAAAQDAKLTPAELSQALVDGTLKVQVTVAPAAAPAAP